MGGAARLLSMLVLVFFNARGVINKEVVLKEFLGKEGAAYCGVGEAHTYKSGSALGDAKWRWDVGPEGKPNWRGEGPKRGTGAFINTEAINASMVDKGKYTVWHRVEVGAGGAPLVVGTGYFPQATDVVGQRAANDELFEFVARFRREGYNVVFGGDLNAHIGANGDRMPTDTAGAMMQETAELMDMVVVNTVPNLCTGGPSRVQVRLDGVQESTVDYVLCSSSLLPYIKSMVIHDDQMESDHKPLVLTLRVPAAKGKKSPLREVWRVNNIPDPDQDRSWVVACSVRMRKWAKDNVPMLEAAAGIGLSSQCVADVLEWSSQCALDGLAAEHLGTKMAGPRATPTVDAAMRMAQQHKAVCSDVLKATAADPAATELARRQGRTQFLSASRAVVACAARRREISELALFRQVEEKQGDSKLFWSKFKQLRNSINVCKSPPPVAVDSDGRTVTDPAEVLRAWREFSAQIASTDLTGTTEEGIYDEEYEREVRARLEVMRQAKIFQPELDGPITMQEVFAALRKLKSGKAPGEDGVLADIIRTAADAVGTNKMRGDTGMVEALVLMFNYVFDNEVWPERWGSGVIVPLHKHDSRLLPSNYRPITLMSIVGKLFGIVVNERLQRFSERMGTISDEQGGFRAHRGTVDQVFLLREILASRRERGQATYTTFIDARKAYDTVWREYTYTRIHDSGVKGKLWRQLQAMHRELRRKVRHPLGMTEEFKVERGVAQGAVESPWMYSNFIDGLAVALKDAGLGVMIAGRRVPLLMYADDVVMLASSVDELVRMNAITTKFAQQHRFQFNGDKSGVMVFNAPKVERERAERQKWVLFGEAVKVKRDYEYLGTILEPNDGSWTKHLTAAIGRAQRRSNDLLWVCRTDKGMRPRTAIVLWQALVRPILEYASEVWSGQVTMGLAKAAELVQTNFLRGTLGLHDNGGGVSNDVVRAEAGCEPLADRWAKLTLGYWRRLFVAAPGRLLLRVARFRHAELTAGLGYGVRGWMPAAQRLLTQHDMGDAWANTTVAADTPVKTWKDRVYKGVEVASNARLQSRLRALPSATQYRQVRAWTRTTSAYAFSSGEVDRMGRLTPQPYLDDRRCLKGTRLKMLCRLGCLPVMDRVGREAKPAAWPKATRTCLMCTQGKVEDVAHFVAGCPAYAAQRSRMCVQVARALDYSIGSVVAEDFAAMDEEGRARVLLGQRTGDPVAEAKIDRHVKKFLVKAWNTRASLTSATNEVMGKAYEVCAFAG